MVAFPLSGIAEDKSVLLLWPQAVLRWSGNLNRLELDRGRSVPERFFYGLPCLGVFFASQIPRRRRKRNDEFLMVVARAVGKSNSAQRSAIKFPDELMKTKLLKGLLDR